MELAPTTWHGEALGTKGRILKAAIELFATKGYAASSIRDIATLVGIEAASIYNHVSSKEELLATIITESTRDGMNSIVEAVESKNGSPIDQLRAATTAHVIYHCRHRQTAQIGWAELRALSADRFKEVRVVRDAYEAIFRDTIVAGVDGGELIDTNVTLAANGILALGSRAAVWFREDGPLSAEEIGEYYADFVIRSLRNPEHESQSK